MTEEERKTKNREYQKRYKEKNKEKIKESSRKYRESHQNKIKAYDKKYQKDNKICIQKYNAERYKNNREEISRQTNEYYQNNKDRRKQYDSRNQQRIQKYQKSYQKDKQLEIKAQKNEYYEKNKKDILAKRKEYLKNNAEKVKNSSNKCSRKRRKNPIFRLNGNISNSIRSSLKSQSLRKNGRHWESLVGYTVLELKEHLESLFQTEMTWGNYGKWHIDHRIPQSFFEIKKIGDVEFKMCWRLENLQPLWASENLSKSNRIL